MRTKRTGVACAALLLGSIWVGCGDDETTTGGGGPSVGGSGGGAGLTGGAAGAGAVGAGGMDVGGAGGTTPGEPCAEGPIAAACDCGGEARSTGWCCSSHWFDPFYATLLSGCPASDAFRYVDPTHAAASDAGPGTADAPWATIEHGVATTSAGQVLIVRPGTYQVEGTASRYTPALNPQSGTEGAPVILMGQGEAVIEPAAVLTGTAQGGSESTIVLATDASSEDNAYVSHHVRLVAGTGAGQARQILRDFNDLAATSYEGATRTVWVSLLATGLGNWQTPPDATSQYELVRNGPLMGTLDRQYVVWDGFHVRERDNYGPDTGSVVLWGSQNVAVINCDLEGMTEMLYDNHNILRIEGTTAATVRNNRLFGLGFPDDAGPNNPQNHAAIMIYASQDLLIEHNEIYDSYTGVFPKGGDRGHVIRNNVVHGCAKAFRISYHDDVRIMRNVVYSCEQAFQLAEENTGILVFNNIVYDGAAGLNNWFPIAGVSAGNNVFLDVASPAYFEGGVGTLASNRNLFFGFTSFVPGDTFEGWQALGFDADSAAVDPLFVDAAAGDFHLAAGSPAATIGRDVADVDDDGDTAETIPAGVYLTGDEVIGTLPER